jgi:hypothetical protein
MGHTAGRIAETMRLLIDLINEPNAALLGQFICRVPMPLIANIAVISPHGWFGQSNVLGKPDTGGQVIYILDQVRALEKHLKEEIRLTGLEVTPQNYHPDPADPQCRGYNLQPAHGKSVSNGKRLDPQGTVQRCPGQHSSGLDLAV